MQIVLKTVSSYNFVFLIFFFPFDCSSDKYGLTSLVSFSLTWFYSRQGWQGYSWDFHVWNLFIYQTLRGTDFVDNWNSELILIFNTYLMHSLQKRCLQDVRNTEQQATHSLSLNSIVAENDPWIVKGVSLEEPIFQRFWMKKQTLHDAVQVYWIAPKVKMHFASASWNFKRVIPLRSPVYLDFHSPIPFSLFCSTWRLFRHIQHLEKTRAHTGIASLTWEFCKLFECYPNIQAGLLRQ